MPDAENPHVRFDEGETWKRSKVMLLRHRQTQAPETDRLNLNHRATSLLYPPNSNRREIRAFQRLRVARLRRLISSVCRRN